MCYNYSEDKEISNMETKQLKKEVESIARYLLDTVSDLERVGDVESQEAMLRVVVAKAHVVLGDLLKKTER